MKITASVVGLPKIAKQVAELKKLPSSSVVWRAVGRVLYRDSMNCFKNQCEPDGTPWTPLSPMTKWKRAYKRLAAYRSKLKKKKLLHSVKYKRFVGEMKILEDTGKLRGSISTRTEQNAAVIGSSLHYARIHQLGGVNEDGRKVPARPYLGLSKKGEADIVFILQKYLQDVADKGGK